MYSLYSYSLLHKCRKPEILTPADQLGKMILGLTGEDDPYTFSYYRIKDGDLTDTVVITTYWGSWRTLQAAMDEYKSIGKAQFNTWLEGEFDNVFRYQYEGVVLYEDGRPVVVFNEPWGGR